MKRSRLAILITDLDVGGAEQCAVAVAVACAAHGWQVEVCAVQPLPNSNRLLNQLQTAGCKVHSLDARGGWQLPWVVALCGQWLRQFQPDLVQTFLFHGNAIGAAAHRRLVQPRPPLVIGLRVVERNRLWRGHLEHWLARNAAQVVCVSSAVQHDAQLRLGWPAEKLTVIGNGVDFARFAQAPPAANMPVHLLTCVSRLDRQKGLDWLLTTAADWLPQLPEHQLLFVGNGPEEGALQRQVVQLGLSDQVKFAGWQADTPGILQASALLLLPSRWEGQPNVVLEAMAAGRGVLATDVEGVRELLGPAADEQVVPAGDATAWSQQLLKLARSPQLRAELGQHNQARAQAEFSLERMTAQYLALYQNLVGSKRD